MKDLLSLIILVGLYTLFCPAQAFSAENFNLKDVVEPVRVSAVVIQTSPVKLKLLSSMYKGKIVELNSSNSTFNLAGLKKGETLMCVLKSNSVKCSRFLIPKIKGVEK